MKSKRIARKIHTWLGISSAIILFFVCFSGSLFVYSDNLLNYALKDKMKVVVSYYTTTIDEIVEKVQLSYPDHFIIDCICYKDEESALKFLIGKEEEGLTHVFVNPYNGNIRGESKLISLISFIAHFHKELLMGEFGAWIVRIATMIFLVELISGIILIVPKNRSKLSTIFKVKRGAPFFRKMFDWHRVSGIYPIVILVIMAVTGVIITFSPKYGIEAEHHHHHGEHEEHEHHAHQIHRTPREQNGKAVKLATILPKFMNQENTNAIKIELWNRQVSPTYQFITGEEVGILTHSGNVHIIDKSTGIEKDNEIRINHMHTNNFIRKLHVGDYWGAFGKAVTFISGLAGAFLALTGCIIWWKKRFKAIH